MLQEMGFLMIDGTPGWDRLRLIRKAESLFIWEMLMLESGVHLRCFSPLSSWAIPICIECRGLLKRSGEPLITFSQTIPEERMLFLSPELRRSLEQTLLL